MKSKINNMDTLIKFDPTVEKLQAIVAETKGITANDLSDDAQLAVVRGTRLQLRDARITIEKQGKAMRTDALKYQKDVIARENELIGIIEPEEIRLKGIEEEATAIKERAARAALLPMRKEMLMKFDTVMPDDDILNMDNDAFMTFLNECQAKKNEMDRQAIEDEKAKLARDTEIAQAEEKARVAERDRIEAKAKAEEATRIEAAAEAKRQVERDAQKLIDDAKAEAERIAQASRDEEAKREAQEEAAIREESVREQQEKDAIAKRQAEKNYQIWLTTIGYKPEDEVLWIFKHSEDGLTGAFKFIGSYKQ